jgi:hypothetical protein
MYIKIFVVRLRETEIKTHTPRDREKERAGEATFI